MDIEAQNTTNYGGESYQTELALLPMHEPRGCNSIHGVTPPTRDAEYLTDLSLSEFFTLPGEDGQMTPEIFGGISEGKCLKELVDMSSSHGTPMACLKSNTGDSILHLAATWGHLELVKEIVPKYPRLLLEPNSTGQTPLHVAARGGHASVVKVFVKVVSHAATLCRDESERQRLNPYVNLYVLKDEDGNTALHYAIKGLDFKMAECLVNANQDAPFLGNNKGFSSLYMAVQAGNLSLVKAILEPINDADLETRNSNLGSKLQGKKHLAHAALLSKKPVVIAFILERYPNLVNERDEKGRTCLSYGAYIGYYEGVDKVLGESPKSVYVRNQDGSFPIHTAAEEGGQEIIELFIRRCPSSKYMLNKLGQNVLHVGAKNGQHWISNLWMKNKDMEHLGVGQDVDGNTPLHLVVIAWNYDSIPWLATSSKILELRNKSGLRAIDIAESNIKPIYIFHERWTLALLLYTTHSKGDKSIISLTRPTEPRDPNNRDYANTLLVVATLVATMTFTAGFTIPGGFSSHDDNNKPHMGRAILAKNPTLCIFLLLDILAMQSSVATIGTLIWAQSGDPRLIRSSLHVALPLLLFALLCMPLAFLFGVITAVGHVKWLLVIICIISLLFFFWAIFILGPHVMLQRSHVSPKYAGYFFVIFMKWRDITEICVTLIKIIFFYH